MEQNNQKITTTIGCPKLSAYRRSTRGISLGRHKYLASACINPSFHEQAQDFHYRSGL